MIKKGERWHRTAEVEGKLLLGGYWPRLSSPFPGHNFVFCEARINMKGGLVGKPFQDTEKANIASCLDARQGQMKSAMRESKITCTNQNALQCLALTFACRHRMTKLQRKLVRHIDECRSDHDSVQSSLESECQGNSGKGQS